MASWTFIVNTRPEETPAPLCYQRLDTQDVQHLHEIVGQHMQRHLANHIRQSLHQEVRAACAHPDCTGGMLDHPVPLAHPLWVHVQPSLDRLLHILVLSARDRALLARGAAA